MDTERLTKLSESKEFYVTANIEGKLGDEGYFGDAVEKLAKFENLHDYLVERQICIPKELEALRNEGKSKTVKFKELLAQKLINETLLDLLASKGITGGRKI